MKKLILLIAFVSLILACSTFPPEKDFKSELWFIDPESMTVMWVNEDDEIITQNFEDLDPTIWVVIKIEHITKEWYYQDLLKNRCEEWR